MKKMAFLVLFLFFVLMFQAIAVCTDSDNGRNYMVKGTAGTETGAATDVCTSCITDSRGVKTCTKVIEKYCSNEKVVSETVICPNGCTQGACVKPNVCTQEYSPVCGLPPSISACPTGAECMQKSTNPITYSNMCMLQSAGATFLYEGECKEGPCKTLFWYDNTNKDCSSKEFCGAYMYQGLYTFNTKEECVAALTTPFSIKYELVRFNNAQGPENLYAYEYVKFLLYVKNSAGTITLNELNKMVPSFEGMVKHSQGTGYWTINNIVISESNYPNGVPAGTVFTYQFPGYIVNSGQQTIKGTLNGKTVSNTIIVLPDPGCYDSDKGNIYVQGYTIGSSSCADQSNCIAHTRIADTCDSSSTLSEYFCENGYSYWKSVSCENGCKDGACLSSSECVQAGGAGPNPSLGPNDPNKDRVCCSGLKQIQQDRYSNGLCANLEGAGTICSDCGNGICESWENPCNCPADCTSETKCTDSDGGANYYVKGTVKSGDNLFYIDRCEESDSSMLLEGVCSEADISYVERYSCPNGCKDGACINRPIPCPVYSPPADGWCEDGTIISGGYDENGCPLPPKCVQEECSADSDCELYFSSCSCSWVCDKKVEVRADCARACPENLESPPEIAPYCGCFDGECKIKNAVDFSYRISTDKKIYNKDETVKIKSIVKGENVAQASVKTWVIFPNGNTHEVDMALESCYTAGCKPGATCPQQTQCTYIGEYVLGGVYPTVSIESTYEEVLSQTPTEIIEVSSDSITANVVAEDSKMMPPGIKSRYLVSSVATIGESRKGAKVFFFTWEQNKEDVEIITEDKYVKGKTVEITVKNGRSGEISYSSGCNKPYNIEQYVKGEGYVIVDNNPCLGTCEGFSTKEIAPGEKAEIGEWGQEVYSDDCTESLAEPGLYRVVFSYRVNGKDGVYTSTKKFNIVSSEGCEPICKAVGTRSEGWYDSCTGELIKYDKCDEDESCNGCSVDSKCLPYGTRLAKSDNINAPVFCDISSKFIEQKKDGKECQNSYECVSNSCNSGKCADLQKEMQETRNLIQRFWDWLKKTF